MSRVIVSGGMVLRDVVLVSAICRITVARDVVLEATVLKTTVLIVIVSGAVVLALSCWCLLCRELL